MTHLFLIGVVAGLLLATHPHGVCIEKYDTAEDIGECTWLMTRD
jgi:hypothetical protein